MQKIPTMFVRDESKPGHPVIDQIKPECQWVLDEGYGTVKMDGTNVKIENGQLLKRQKPKDRDYDEASYVPCDHSNPADRWAYEAFASLDSKEDGVYELLGPKVQGNPHRFIAHRLMRVVPMNWSMSVRQIYGQEAPRTFAALAEFLATCEYEGIVFHHPDGRMAKIKRRDFGLSWPPGGGASQEP